MSQPRPVFQPITPPTDVSDEEIADFAREKGVGTMVKSASQAPALAPQNAQDASNDDARTPPTAPSPRKGSTAKKTAPAPDRDLKLSVMVPRYLAKPLRQRCLDDDCTERHLVLLGLQAVGLPVKEADLIPDRRLHRKTP